MVTSFFISRIRIIFGQLCNSSQKKLWTIKFYSKKKKRKYFWKTKSEYLLKDWKKNIYKNTAFYKSKLQNSPQATQSPQ